MGLGLPTNGPGHIGVGPPCVITHQITGSWNTFTEGRPQSRLLDLHHWRCWCPFPPRSGIGFNLPGSFVTYVNGLNIHRLLDLQAICSIEIVITSNHRTFSG